MPSMANITVKKFDGTTDIVYDAIAAAAGDGSAAFWRQDTGATAGMPVGHRPSLAVLSRWNGPRTARRVQGTFKAPYSVLNTSTNRYEVTDLFVLDFSAVIPQAIPATNINESAYQGGNLIGSLLLKSILAAGWSAT